MQEPKFYLKQNVQCEPLFNQWYAWTHLIAPHTAAMFISNLHLKIMKSYVQAANSCECGKKSGHAWWSVY